MSEPSRFRQRGIVTAMAVLLLITLVIFTLSQTLSITGTSSSDSASQLDSTAALFLAESGLENGQSILAGAGSITAAICQSVTTLTPYTLGRGTVALTGVASPPGCGVAPKCTGCAVQATGTVGSASRTVVGNMVIGTPAAGVAGRGTVVTYPGSGFKNKFSVPAVALFNLGWVMETGGSTSATLTANPSNALRWNTQSSSGLQAGGSMGVSSYVAGGGKTNLTQTLSDSKSYAEVGILLGSASNVANTPVVIGSYWDDTHTAGSMTVNNQQGQLSTHGQTNSGVANNTANCLAPSMDHTTNFAQTCNSWCNGGDTLVFGVTVNSGNANTELTSVTFNTDPAATPPQNVALTKTAHFPAMDGSTPNADGTVYAEVWYAYNANPFSVVTPSASSGGVTGAIGATLTAASIGADVKQATISDNSNVLKINSYNSGILQIGDAVFTSSCGNIAVGTTVTGYNLGTDDYTLSAAPTTGCSKKVMKFKSSKLTVATPVGMAAGSGALENGATISSAGTTYGTIKYGSGAQVAGLPYGTTGLENGVWYTVVSGAAQGPTGSVPITAPSLGPTLTVSAVQSGALYAGDALYVAGVASGTVAAGATTITSASTFPATVALAAGSPTYLAPSAILTPTVTLTGATIDATGPGTLINVYSGNGRFAANGAASGNAPCTSPYVPTRYGMCVMGTLVSGLVGAGPTFTVFTLSQVPTIALTNATICGGTCAFFNTPNSTNSGTTQFTVVKANNSSNQWEGGFACASGVDPTKITFVDGSSSITGMRWSEPPR